MSAPVSVSDDVAPPGSTPSPSSLSVASKTESCKSESRSKSGKTTLPSTGDPTLLPGSSEVDPEVPEVVEMRESERARRGEAVWNGREESVRSSRKRGPKKKNTHRSSFRLFERDPERTRRKLVT